MKVGSCWGFWKIFWKIRVTRFMGREEFLGISSTSDPERNAPFGTAFFGMIGRKWWRIVDESVGSIYLIDSSFDWRALLFFFLIVFSLFASRIALTIDLSLNYCSLFMLDNKNDFSCIRVIVGPRYSSIFFFFFSFHWNLLVFFFFHCLKWKLHSRKIFRSLDKLICN